MLKQKFLITYLTAILSLIFGMASSIIIARIAGPNVVGTLAFGMAFVTVFQFIADLGIGTAHQKLVTSTNDISDYIATYAVLKISTSFLFLVIIVAYYYVQVHFLGNHDTTRIRSILTDERHLGVSFLILFTIHGIPKIYYGDEIGMRGIKAKRSDADVRRPMIISTEEWPAHGKEIFQSIIKLNEIRRNNHATSNYRNIRQPY